MIFLILKFEKLICAKLARLLGMKILKSSIGSSELENKAFKKSSKLNSTLDNDQKVESVEQETPQNEKIDGKKREELELKCKYAAIVMDRFFFCLALAYAVITFSTLVLSIPKLYS